MINSSGFYVGVHVPSRFASGSIHGFTNIAGGITEPAGPNPTAKAIEFEQKAIEFEAHFVVVDNLKPYGYGSIPIDTFLVG